jgi:GNAT superfamily N-acetyltransferase
MRPCTIQPAVESDVPLLLDLIRELAEFESLGHELEVTVESLHAALFGQDKVARAVIARMNGVPAGYAIFYRTFSSFVGRPGVFLDDLYVRPGCRKLGIGRALLSHVAREGTKLGGGRFEWIALRWNENALRFYHSIGASEMNQWALLRMNTHDTQVLGNQSLEAAT